MIFALKTPDFHEKCRFFALFQNQSKVIGHLFCNFAADLADGACFCSHSARRPSTAKPNLSA